MPHIARVLVSAAILLGTACESQWRLLADAFSTGMRSSITSNMATSRIRPIPILHAQSNDNDLISTDDDTNNTDTKGSHSSKDKAALIWLHGLGDSPDGWSSLAESLPNLRPSISELDMTYVFPPANMMGITVNGGEKMPGWFDVYDWPIGVDAKDDPKGLAMSVKRVEKIVTQLKEEEGITPDRVVVGGFSQGGAVAIMAAYNRRKKDATPFAGCICMSGWLPMKKYLDVSEEAAASTPLFWAHGQYDDKILFEQQMYGVNKLENEGVDVIACAYPVGHEATGNYEEIDDMAGFLENVLCPEPQTEKVPKHVQVDGAFPGSLTEEDEANALLYYLCAMGIEDESTMVDSETVSSAATIT